MVSLFSDFLVLFFLFNSSSFTRHVDEVENIPRSGFDVLFLGLFFLALVLFRLTTLFVGLIIFTESALLTKDFLESTRLTLTFFAVSWNSTNFLGFATGCS